MFQLFSPGWIGQTALSQGLSNPTDWNNPYQTAGDGDEEDEWERQEEKYLVLRWINVGCPFMISPSEFLGTPGIPEWFLEGLERYLEENREKTFISPFYSQMSKAIKL
jgi:hypothetical protein